MEQGEQLMNRVSDPVYFGIASALRDHARLMAYPAPVIIAGCRAAKAHIDQHDMPDGLALLESYFAGRDAMRGAL